LPETLFCSLDFCAIDDVLTVYKAAADDRPEEHGDLASASAL
jgi:hypothetical protein